jgi:DNA-binding CsgD family transcriptional regulator
MAEKKEPITGLEKSIVQYLSEGKTAYEIADLRKVTHSTISTQLGTLRYKMGCKTTIQLIAECLRQKLIE